MSHNLPIPETQLGINIVLQVAEVWALPKPRYQEGQYCYVLNHAEMQEWLAEREQINESLQGGARISRLVVTIRDIANDMYTVWWRGWMDYLHAHPDIADQGLIEELARLDFNKTFQLIWG